MVRLKRRALIPKGSLSVFIGDSLETKLAKIYYLCNISALNYFFVVVILTATAHSLIQADDCLVACEVAVDAAHLCTQQALLCCQYLEVCAG
jgi:hypothetical protein